MSSRWARTALSHRICTGLRRRTLAKLIGELSGPWMKAGEDRLRGRRGHERKRAAAQPDHDLPFTNRVIATLVYLRFQLPHAALAVLYGVDRSTITRAVGEIRPLLAARGFAVPGKAACGCAPWPTCSLTPPPAASNCAWTAPKCRSGARARASRAAARSCQARRSRTRKRPPLTDGKAAPCGRRVRPGRMHDQTAVRTEGIADLFTQFPQVKAKVDAGYRGMAKEFPDQVQAPPLKPKKDPTPEETAAYEAERHKQSSERICVEHANAEHKQWRTLQRYLGRQKTSTRPSWPSPAWSPTAPPNGNPTPANPPGQHGPPLIAHYAVSSRSHTLADSEAAPATPGGSSLNPTRFSSALLPGP